MRDYIEKFEFEMRLLNYCETTIVCYSNVLKLFIENFGIEFNNITIDQIKAYLKNSSSQALLKQRIGAMKLFYRLVLNNELFFSNIYYPRSENHIPVILSVDEVRRLFETCSNPKHKAILYLFYSTGMRRSELINLKITDIDSSRMLIRIKQAKGKKDRFVPLSAPTLEALRLYFRKCKPQDYLFNGQFSLRYSSTSISLFIKRYAAKASITKNVYPHLLRHCTGTHLLEANVDVSKIQNMFGHKQQKTTLRYAQFSSKVLSSIPTPDLYL